MMRVLLVLLLIQFVAFAHPRSLHQNAALKRSVAMDARQMLLRALAEPEPPKQQPPAEQNQDPSNTLRQRFTDMAAFGYALLSTYTVRSSIEHITMQMQTSMGGVPSLLAQMADLVPEQFKSYFGPSTGSSDDTPSDEELNDIKCVNNCIKQVERHMMDKMDPARAFNQLGSDFDFTGRNGLNGQRDLTTMAVGALKLNCSDEFAGRDCLANCAKETTGSNYSKFLLSQLNWFLGQNCARPTDQVDIMQLLGTCQLDQIPQLALSFTFSFGDDFVSRFNKAVSDQQRCSVVKTILIDEFSHSLSGICTNSAQARLFERMFQTTAGYALAQNTEGAIFKRCPDVYKTN